MESDPPAGAPLVCAECGRAPRQDENAADGSAGEDQHEVGVNPNTTVLVEEH